MESSLEKHLCETFETVANKVLLSIQRMIDTKSYLNIFRDNDLEKNVSFVEMVVMHLYCKELFENENPEWGSEVTVPVIITLIAP
jgi:hypothetical protein